jgi:sarcosine oxidase
LGDGTRLSAEVVVNCAGHHALGLLSGVSCRVARPATLQQVIYVATDDNVPPPPVFIEWGPDMIYGLPVTGQPRYKVAQHLPAASLGAGTDEQWREDDPLLLGPLVDAVRRLLPGLDPHPVATERCVYDNTADADFIVDRIGRVVVGCGTSGHGFKFAPLLGELLADLALGLKPPIDLSRFSLSRSFLHIVADT